MWYYSKNESNFLRRIERRWHVSGYQTAFWKLFTAVMILQTSEHHEQPIRGAAQQHRAAGVKPCNRTCL